MKNQVAQNLFLALTVVIWAHVNGDKSVTINSVDVNSLDDGLFGSMDVTYSGSVLEGKLVVKKDVSETIDVLLEVYGDGEKKSEIKHSTRQPLFDADNANICDELSPVPAMSDTRTFPKGDVKISGLDIKSIAGDCDCSDGNIIFKVSANDKAIIDATLTFTIED